MAKELQELGNWKVGMLVYDNGNSYRPESLTRITRITDGRGGTIYVGESSFDINGSQRGSDTWSKQRIQVATPVDLQRIKENNAIERLSRFDWKSLRGDQAVIIQDTLLTLGIDLKKKA